MGDMESVFQWAPLPIDDVGFGIEALGRSEPVHKDKTNLYVGTYFLSLGVLHTLFAVILSVGAGWAGRHFKYGGVLATIGGAVISVPTALISGGVQALVYGVKSLPTAIKAKNALGIGKSLAWIGGAVALLYGDRPLYYLPDKVEPYAFGLGERFLMKKRAHQFAEFVESRFS